MSQNGVLLGEYVSSNKIRFIEPHNLNYDRLSYNERNNLKSELINIGAEEIYDPDHTERDLDLNSKNYLKLDNLIKKYWDECVYVESKTNRKVVNLKKIYELAYSNPDDKKFLDSVLLGKGTQMQKLFTKTVNDMINIPNSKYYVGKDNNGNRIRGIDRHPIIFIK